VRKHTAGKEEEKNATTNTQQVGGRHEKVGRGFSSVEVNDSRARAKLWAANEPGEKRTQMPSGKTSIDSVGRGGRKNRQGSLGGKNPNGEKPTPLSKKGTTGGKAVLAPNGKREPSKEEKGMGVHEKKRGRVPTKNRCSFIPEPRARTQERRKSLWGEGRNTVGGGLGKFVLWAWGFPPWGLAGEKGLKALERGGEKVTSWEGKGGGKKAFYLVSATECGIRRPAD